MALLSVAAKEDRAAGVPIDITFQNRGDRLIGLGFWNGLLMLLTLGLYSFWGKTEVRRRLWSFIRLNDEPLEYTGRGKELFLGFLIALIVVVLPITVLGMAVALYFPNNRTAIALYQATIYLVFFLLIGNAIYRAWRYRMSRTRWRGIRTALIGSPTSYGWLYFWTIALPFGMIALAAGLLAWLIGPEVGGVIMISGLLLGSWILPWRANKLQKRLTTDMRFGDRPLTFDGTSGPLYKAYTFAWLGSVVIIFAALVAIAAIAISNNIVPDAFTDPTRPPPIDAARYITLMAAIAFGAFVLVAIISAWYRASQVKHFARHTHFDRATFRSEVTGKGLAWIVVSNWLLRAIGFILAIAVAAALFRAFGLFPQLPDAADPETPVTTLMGDMGRSVIAVVSFVTFTTITGTFAQFRSARYFMSRLKLDGSVDLAAIAQSQATDPKRGEGLAQVFDIDAF